MVWQGSPVTLSLTCLAVTPTSLHTTELWRYMSCIMRKPVFGGFEQPQKIARGWEFQIKNLEIYEPCCEKTGLLDFRPGPTQTGLYSHRRWLEA